MKRKRKINRFKNPPKEDLPLLAMVAALGYVAGRLGVPVLKITPIYKDEKEDERKDF